jgi:hypothetical protein
MHGVSDMTILGTFLTVFTSMWLIGSAFAVGIVTSRRNKRETSAWPGFLWAVVFSWAFVGWMAGEFIAMAFQTAASKHQIVSSEPENRS